LNLRYFGSFTFILVSYGESRCLSRGLQVAGVACHTTTRIMAGVGDLVQRIKYYCTGRILGGRTIERSDGAMCGLHRAHGDKKREFLG
jgi:hypothetical protein